MIEWKKSLELGIDAIDQQHFRLIQTLEDLYDACSRGEGMQKMQQTILFLEWYVEKHFDDEECIQKKCAYPRYGEHHSIHQFYIDEFKQLGIDFASEPSNIEHLSKLISYLTKIIKQHISYEDRAFVDYMHQIETDLYEVLLEPQGQDALTGFMNKEEFQKYAYTVLKMQKENLTEHFAYVTTKIDGFEQVKKSYGYEIGDEMIIYVSGILHNITESGLMITIGRMHRDEFMMLIRYEDDLEKVTTYLEKVKAAIVGGFKREGSLIPLSMSMGGVACIESAMHIKQVHQQATIALDIARSNNHNQLRWYEERMYESMREKAEIIRLLQSHNLTQSLFVLFQPIYDLENNIIKGAELLLRMRDRESNVIAPSKFISLAEENNLMTDIGYFCIAEACKLLRTLGDEGIHLDYISINLSVQQLKDPYLIKCIEKYVRQYQIDPKHLHFEIIESMVIDDYDQTQSILNSLKNLGCKILLDDFGTGYSSLSYLSHIAIDVVKIDKSFLGELQENHKARIVFENIIQLIQKLNMGCIVEGVETEEERHYVEIYGAQFVQGYLLSRPLTIGNFIELLRSRGA